MRLSWAMECVSHPCAFSASAWSLRVAWRDRDRAGLRRILNYSQDTFKYKARNQPHSRADTACSSLHCIRGTRSLVTTARVPPTTSYHIRKLRRGRIVLQNGGGQRCQRNREALLFSWGCVIPDTEIPLPNVSSRT